jgi:hypothetical protein
MKFLLEEIPKKCIGGKGVYWIVNSEGIKVVELL